MIYGHNIKYGKLYLLSINTNIKFWTILVTAN